jgi:hypothetical protein
MKYTPLQWTRFLVLFTVAILVVFGVGSLLRIGAKPENALLYTFYAILMFGDAAIMLFCALQLYKRTKMVFLLSAFVLFLNIFLTIFDQFGVVDLLFVSINIAALTFLILARREFLPA